MPAEFCDDVADDTLLSAVRAVEQASAKEDTRNPTPAQQFSALYDTIQDLGDEFEIQSIRDQKRLREVIKKQLPQKYLEIDQRYMQSMELFSDYACVFTHFEYDDCTDGIKTAKSGKRS